MLELESLKVSPWGCRAPWGSPTFWSPCTSHWGSSRWRRGAGSGQLEAMRMLLFIAAESKDHNSVVLYSFVGPERVGRRGQGSSLLWRTSEDTEVYKFPHSGADNRAIVLRRRLAEAALGAEGFNWDSHGKSRRALRVRSSAGVNPHGPADFWAAWYGREGHLLPLRAPPQPAKDNYMEMNHCKEWGGSSDQKD